MGRRIGGLLIALLLCCALVGCGGPKELTDGQYTVSVALAGGTGRVSVASPAEITVEGGVITAEIIWSSPYYEYMLVSGERYEPVSMEGGSTFRIPVELDTDMAVSACTVAMSEPHLIDYTLRFDSATAREAGA